MTNEFAIKVLNELRSYGDKFANIGFDRKEALDMAIKALEQEPKWIPVSERLPEDVGGEYLVNIEYEGKHEGIDIAEYQIGGYMDGLWITPNDWIEGPSELWHVTAWMPLPEPYRAESEVKE